jgi:protein gp37
MTVLKSDISWTTGTLNLTVGCTRVSAACDNCYAATLVHRLMGGGFYERMRFHPERLKDLRKFAPARNGQGELEPKMVFVNSLSDFWHEAIPSAFVNQALDAFERHPATIFQILTKRPGRMRRFVEDRYSNSGVPAHFWLGVTCEDNRVKRTLDILRATKDRVGEFTAFASVEPITAPCDELDYTGLDWVLTGGESGPRARPMQFEWLEQANEKALSAGIPLHFKQYGRPRNNPKVLRLMKRYGIGVSAAFKFACDNRFELAPHEKGGATYKRRVYNEKPAHWHRLKAELNRGNLVADQATARQRRGPAAV